MPYIKPADRTKFNHNAEVIATTAECAGDLNYAITVILHLYLKRKGIKYANINELVGMMECCKTEFYRTVATPYEDVKMKENGGVGIINDSDLQGKKY